MLTAMRRMPDQTSCQAFLLTAAVPDLQSAYTMFLLLHMHAMCAWIWSLSHVSTVNPIFEIVTLRHLQASSCKPCPTEHVSIDICNKLCLHMVPC